MRYFIITVCLAFLLSGCSVLGLSGSDQLRQACNVYSAVLTNVAFRVASGEFTDAQLTTIDQARQIPTAICINPQGTGLSISAALLEIERAIITFSQMEDTL